MKETHDIQKLAAFEIRKLRDDKAGVLPQLRKKLGEDLAATPITDVEAVLRAANRIVAVDAALDVVDRRIIADAAEAIRKAKLALQCAELVYHSHGGRNYSYSRNRCKNKGKFEEDHGDLNKEGEPLGLQWWCKTHSKVGQAEREERQRATWKAQSARQLAQSQSALYDRDAGYFLRPLAMEYLKLVKQLRRDMKECPELAKTITLLRKFGRYKE